MQGRLSGTESTDLTAAYLINEGADWQRNWIPEVPMGHDITDNDGWV